MLENQLNSVINRPVKEVFRYITHFFVDDTPKWDDAIAGVDKNHA